jgi:RimJ/RimL family protein N-acetyltransferase
MGLAGLSTREDRMILETGRLHLRHLALTDAPFIVELLNDPGFIRNIGDRGVRTLEQAREYILTGPVASYERHGFGLDIVESKQTGSGIGICGLLRRECHPDIEIGFAFLPQARGQNYAFEAAGAVIDFAIRSQQVARIVALTAPDNFASIRVLERLGFRFERLVSWMDPVRGSRLFAFEHREGSGNVSRGG